MALELKEIGELRLRRNSIHKHTQNVFKKTDVHTSLGWAELRLIKKRQKSKKRFQHKKTNTRNKIGSISPVSKENYPPDSVNTTQKGVRLKMSYSRLKSALSPRLV